MAEVINGLVFTNVADLDEIDEIQNGDYIVVESSDGTRIINFENFLIPIENTTFEQTIEDIQLNINSLSSNYVATKSGYLTVGYSVSGGSGGVIFSSPGYVLPINWIQSNTIDGNFTNGSNTYVGITSAYNVVNLDPGTYHLHFRATFNGSVFVDLFNTSNNTVLLTSDYSTTPMIDGLISLSERSQLTFRGYTTSTTALGQAIPFYTDGLIKTPLVASFQYLTDSTTVVNQPDKRTS